MRRIVILPVDDRVTHLAIEHQDDTMLGGGGEEGDVWPDLVKAERVPVPPDGELTRALDLLTDAPGPGRSNEHFERLIDAAALVREAAGLDEEQS